MTIQLQKNTEIFICEGLLQLDLRWFMLELRKPKSRVLAGELLIYNTDRGYCLVITT